MQADNLDPVERVGVCASHRGLLNNDKVFELIQNWLGVSPKDKKHLKTSKVMDEHYSRPVEAKNSSLYWLGFIVFSLCILIMYLDMYAISVLIFGRSILFLQIWCPHEDLRAEAHDLLGWKIIWKKSLQWVIHLLIQIIRHGFWYITFQPSKSRKWVNNRYCNGISLFNLIFIFFNI